MFRAGAGRVEKKQIRDSALADSRLCLPKEQRPCQNETPGKCVSNVLSSNGFPMVLPSGA